MLSIKRRGKDEYLRIVQDMINYRREHGMVMLDNILNGTHVPSEDDEFIGDFFLGCDYVLCGWVAELWGEFCGVDMTTYHSLEAKRKRFLQLLYALDGSFKDSDERWNHFITCNTDEEKKKFMIDYFKIAILG